MSNNKLIKSKFLYQNYSFCNILKLKYINTKY